MPICKPLFAFALFAFLVTPAKALQNPSLPHLSSAWQDDTLISTSNPDTIITVAPQVAPSVAFDGKPYQVRQATIRTLTAQIKGLSPAEAIIVNMESGGRDVCNTSDHCGIGQLSTGNRAVYAPLCETTPNTHDLQKQLCMMRGYIKHTPRYGTAEKALEYEILYHSY